MTTEEFRPLGRVIDVSNVLFEICGDLSIPYSSRDSDRDGAANGAPKIEHSDSDGHVLVGYRSLDGNVGCSDDDGSANTGENLGADEYGIGGTSGR